MRDAVRELIKWTVVPAAFVLMCAAAGAAHAWTIHGNDSEALYYFVNLAAFAIPLLAAIALAIALGTSLFGRICIAALLIVIGTAALLASGLNVACGAYHACL